MLLPQAAIEYNLKHMEEAKEALTDMPPRLEEELDPVRYRIWDRIEKTAQPQ